jgi:hypothetical protein
VIQLHRELGKKLKRKRNHLDNGYHNNEEKTRENDQNIGFIQEDTSE